jgi:hypothetical protein
VGGARWNLYRRGKRIDVTQSLVHTLIVPKGVTGLRLRVTTWICESGFLGGPATRWTFAKTFPVSLEGRSSSFRIHGITRSRASQGVRVCAEEMLDDIMRGHREYEYP